MDPVTVAIFLAGLFAKGAGAKKNADIQNQYIEDTNAAVLEAANSSRMARLREEWRQKGLEKDQMSSVLNALYETDPGARAAAINARMTGPNQFTDAADDYKVGRLQGQVQDGIVSKDIAKTVNDGVKATRRILRGQGTLSEQGTSSAAVARALAGMTDDLANIGSNRRNSADVARIEAAVPPADVEKDPSIMGDLLMMFGDMALGYGGRRFGKTGGFGGGSPDLGNSLWDGSMY